MTGFTDSDGILKLIVWSGKISIWHKILKTQKAMHWKANFVVFCPVESFTAINLLRVFLETLCEYKVYKNVYNSSLGWTCHIDFNCHIRKKTR